MPRRRRCDFKDLSIVDSILSPFVTEPALPCDGNDDELDVAPGFCNCIFPHSASYECDTDADAAAAAAGFAATRCMSTINTKTQEISLYQTLLQLMPLMLRFCAFIDFDADTSAPCTHGSPNSM